MTYWFHFWEYIQKETKISTWTNIYTLVFIAALFRIAKAWKQPLEDKWIKFCYMFKQLNIIQPTMTLGDEGKCQA